jgi:hypothetical protein
VGVNKVLDCRSVLGRQVFSLIMEEHGPLPDLSLRNPPRCSRPRIVLIHGHAGENLASLHEQ